MIRTVNEFGEGHGPMLGLVVSLSNEIIEREIDADKHAMCGHKTSKSFTCIDEWMHEHEEAIVVIQLWGKTVGSKKLQNEYFASYTSTSIYGTALVTALDDKGDMINMTEALWIHFTDKTIYNCDSNYIDDDDAYDKGEDDEDKYSEAEGSHYSDNDEHEIVNDEDEIVDECAVAVQGHELTREEYDY